MGVLLDSLKLTSLNKEDRWVDFNKTNILFNQDTVNVNLIGTDHKQIPSLLHALKTNKLTLGNIQTPLKEVDLYNTEAILYSEKGDKYRVPLF
ncbi:hypothetical protein [Paenibacillus sp. Soil750]|uniref:hypothetical protein n=1 Tax=Paenibacillus sp. Soil750 TaxID=1736398 RepID=UPI000AD07C09|nr:hypothetical protein [Paenibacillus sp. Soil750]